MASQNLQRVEETGGDSHQEALAHPSTSNVIEGLSEEEVDAAHLVKDSLDRARKCLGG